MVIDGKVHLFYQTYGNQSHDAICHAVSDDGVKFTRDASNPVFHPTGDWTVGRAIDAEAFVMGDRLLLYFATRDPLMKTQMVGVASSTNGLTWKLLANEHVLANGASGTWNSSESGHPGVFVDQSGQTWLFYQGNPDKGRTWFLSRVPISWSENQPHIAPEPVAH